VYQGRKEGRKGLYLDRKEGRKEGRKNGRKGVYRRQRKAQSMQTMNSTDNTQSVIMDRELCSCPWRKE
jgi:hypothetical protein